MEDTLRENISVTDWLGRPWIPGVSKTPAAHPNSRFCTPAAQCPIIDKDWENPDGVPISAILFGGRRPAGVPLVYEAFSWQHGVFVGATMRSEATAAAEHKGKIIMNDPFAMRPFFGYNFGAYLKHWLSMERRANAYGAQPPKIFHVNWFRKDANGKFLWPGFGDNIRVLEWILKRINNEPCYVRTPIGYIPSKDSLNTSQLQQNIDINELFSIPKDFWRKEVDDIQRYFDEQVGNDLPKEIVHELLSLKKRIEHSE